MTDFEDWDELSSLLPEGWRELCRSTGAMKRFRGFKSADALLRTLLLHVGYGHALRETAVRARLAGLASVSDVALLNRLRDAEAWLLEMCLRLWKDNAVDLQAAVLDRPTRLLDATIVREPGKTGRQWRLHYSLRLPALQCDHFELTRVQGKGTGEQLGRFQFQPGELVLADAGYCHAAGIAAVVEAKADVCVRLNPRGLSLSDERGEPFVALEHLATLNKTGDVGDWPIQIVQDGHVIAGRVCAIRKTAQAIRQALAKLDRKRHKKQTKELPQTRRYAEYVLVLTTLDASAASAQQVLDAYRLRWQIELAFKRMKSTLDLGHVPKYDPRSSRAWLYAKLLVALLGEKLSRTGKTFSPWGYLVRMPHTQPMA